MRSPVHDINYKSIVNRMKMPYWSYLLPYIYMHFLVVLMVQKPLTKLHVFQHKWHHYFLNYFDNSYYSSKIVTYNYICILKLCYYKVSRNIFSRCIFIEEVTLRFCIEWKTYSITSLLFLKLDVLKIWFHLQYHLFKCNI